MEDLIGDQRRRAEIGEIGIAVLHDLDRGQHHLDGIARLRSAAGTGEVVPKLHGDFTLGAGSEKSIPGQCAAVAVQARLAHEPGGRTR